MNNINSYSRALDFQSFFCLGTETLWMTGGSCRAPFSLHNAVFTLNPLFLPVILGEDQFFLKILKLLNIDTRVWNEFWMHHLGMLENLGPFSVPSRDQTLWVSFHMSCQCPHRDAVGVLPPIIWKEVSQICALQFPLFYFQTCLTGNEKKAWQWNCKWRRL